MLKLGTYVVDRESRDYSASSNGGEYEFGHTSVLLKGVEVGRLLSTSASFGYCQLSGTFTRTKRVDVVGTDITFWADTQMEIEDEITQEEFIEWVISFDNKVEDVEHTSTSEDSHNFHHTSPEDLPGYDGWKNFYRACYGDD